MTRRRITAIALGTVALLLGGARAVSAQPAETCPSTTLAEWDCSTTTTTSTTKAPGTKAPGTIPPGTVPGVTSTTTPAARVVPRYTG